MASEEVREFRSSHLAISKNLVQQSWANRLARVDRYDRASPVLVPHEMVTAADSQNAEASLMKRGDEFVPRDTRTAAHAAMVTR